MEKRTDLAMERLGPVGEPGKKPEGVKFYREKKYAQEATVVEITGKNGERTLGRPRGKYVTIEVDNVLRRDKDSFHSAVSAISSYLGEMLQLEARLPVLVAGLGNRDITPDLLGPLTADHILVTRHMVRQSPRDFVFFRPVCAISPGVLGTTGMESAETVRALVERSQAAAVIAVDAIAARDTGKLCAAVQISDTGICPGSGVGNHRNALDRSTLGVPVIALGVPTVTDAATLAMDLMEGMGLEPREQGLNLSGGMIVTCSDIDRRVREIARVLSFAINTALQPGLSQEDITDLTF